MPNMLPQSPAFINDQIRPIITHKNVALLHWQMKKGSFIKKLLRLANDKEICYNYFVMLKPKKKISIIKEHQTHEKDTGSSEVQIALLSKQIESLTAHLKKHSKDQHSRRGLLQMVSKRKSLMDYLKKTSTRRYNSLVKKVGLKK